MEMSDYDPLNGRIYGTFFGQDEDIIRLQLFPGRELIDGRHSGSTHYVLNGVPAERPSQATTLTGQTLSGLPYPCTLWIDGDSYTVDEATVELDLPLAGTYALRVEAFPYLDWKGSITIP